MYPCYIMKVFFKVNKFSPVHLYILPSLAQHFIKINSYTCILSPFR